MPITASPAATIGPTSVAIASRCGLTIEQDVEHLVQVGLVGGARRLAEHQQDVAHDAALVVEHGDLIGVLRCQREEVRPRGRGHVDEVRAGR